MSPETIMHYAMLLRLISIMAVGTFGLGIAILVSFLRRHLARIDARAVEMPSRRLVRRG